jgi:hypothetical protein
MDTRRPLVRRAIAAAVAVLAIPLALVATASSASASTGKCSTDALPSNTSVTVYTCAYISGSGRHVNYMRMHACVYGPAGAWVKFAIYEPDSDGVPWHVSRQWYRSHGNCTPEFYGPHGTVKAGSWTFRSFDASDGIEISSITLTVRS